MKLTKNGQRYHQPEVTPQESDSKPKEDLPLYLWAPECHEKIFTEYSDVFTFGMLIWELFQIVGECRQVEQCGNKCKLLHCKAYKHLKGDFSPPRDQKLPVPRLLEENDAANQLKERMHKCWRYQYRKPIQENPHQKT